MRQWVLGRAAVIFAHGSARYRGKAGPLGASLATHCNCVTFIASFAGPDDSAFARASWEEYREDCMRYEICLIAVAAATSWAIGSMATAQQGGSTQKAIAANPANNSEQELGRRFLIKAEDLPPPKSDPVAASDLYSSHTQGKHRE